MERVQFHGSIQKANEKQEMTSHRSPAWLEHAKAIIKMFATRPNRVTNNSSSSPFVYKLLLVYLDILSWCIS